MEIKVKKIQIFYKKKVIKKLQNLRTTQKKFSNNRNCKSKIKFFKTKIRILKT